MASYFLRISIFLVISLLVGNFSTAQTAPKDSGSFIRMPASTNYYKSKSYRNKWGQHYRTEWHTPVLFQKVLLDTLAGGLTPYEMGGGRQTKNIRLRDARGREYVLRSIDKSLGGALPEIARGSFLEDIADDQVTFSHPYAALIVAPLAEAAGIYHTNPVIRYVPKQAALNNYNDSVGNNLYLFEQRPDGNWETAANFGNSPDIESTDKMLKKILADNDNSIDAPAYLRARLFDMLIGDWGRHEDQWRWAKKEGADDKKIYLPIPRDRDNAFSKLDGWLLKPVLSAAGGGHMQNFTGSIKDVAEFNFTARNLDRRLLSGLSFNEWNCIAADLQARLTDAVIEKAVQQLPPEVYPISGPALAAKLKNRRNELDQYAATYYSFLAKEVAITGSEKNELFRVSFLDTAALLQVYKIDKNGVVQTEPLLSRRFTKATKEITIYGIGGKDRFEVKGQRPADIKIRLVGSPQNNDYNIEKGSAKRLHIYDNKQATVANVKKSQVHFSKDSAITRYDYDWSKADKSGVLPYLFYSNFDRIYAALSYSSTKHSWRSEPYAIKQRIVARYSLIQNAISATYEAHIPHSIMQKLDLNFFADYDQVRWRNFYGLGNQNIINNNIDFNRVRSREILIKTGVSRNWKNHHRIYLNAMFQNYDVINDTDRVLNKLPQLQDPDLYKAKQFAGAELRYMYQNVDSRIYATRGLAAFVGADGLQNLQKNNRQVFHYTAGFNWYQPLSSIWGLKISGAAAALTGDPEFYQYNTIGGTESMRGYQRNRFYGNTTVSSQNEIRFLPNIRSKLMNGKLGLFAFYDFGRVWLDGEDSNQLYSGYGGGIVIIPFNKIAVTLAYGIGKDDSNLHFNLVMPLF